MAEGTSEPLISRKGMIRRTMINKLANTEAHFKHQQRGEPDLSLEEKSKIASSILEKSSSLFLERFSRYLTLEDTEYFSDEKGDYQIDFYIEEIQRRCADSNHDANVVKNRRYRALQELIADGDYFSEDEMKWRDPLLFEQMIGQYQTDSEKTEEMEQDFDRSDLRFSTILLKHMDTQANKQFYEVLKEREEEQEEEEEDSDEEEEEEEIDVDEEIDKKERKGETGPSEEDIETAYLDRIFMRNEFLRIMQERFLSGEDRNFDYSKVDNNADYDSLDIVGQDAEEKYFDADDNDLDDSSDSDIASGEVTTACDRHIRRRLRGMVLMKDTESEKTEGCGSEEKTSSEMIDTVEDYMMYVPSEKLVEQRHCENL